MLGICLHPTLQLLPRKLVLNNIYDNKFSKSVKLLTTNATVYGISLFGDGSAIMTSNLVNFWGNRLYFQSVVLDILDCTGHCKEGKKKDAPYIEIVFLPIIKELEKRNPERKSNAGIVYLVLFDGATNLQNVGNIMVMR